MEAEEEEQEIEEVEDLLEYYLQKASATQDEAERLLAGLFILWGDLEVLEWFLCMGEPGGVAGPPLIINICSPVARYMLIKYWLLRYHFSLDVVTLVCLPSMIYRLKLHVLLQVPAISKSPLVSALALVGLRSTASS